MQIPGLGGSPYDRVLRDELNALAEEFNTLSAVHAERIERYEQYRAELGYSREPLSVRQADNPEWDYGNASRLSANIPKRHAIALPFGQALTVKNTFRIAGRMPDVVVPRREETGYERYRSNLMEKVVWGIHQASSGDVQFASAAWDGSQLGASCFDLYFDPRIQLPRFREVDPATFLEVPGDLDKHDFKRVYRFWDSPIATVKADYAGKDFRGTPIPLDNISPFRKEGVTEYVRIVQMCDRNKRIRFALGKNPTALMEETHNLGFAPYVVIPNLGPERDVWGWSDYEFVRDLVSYLPQLFSREADLIRQVANGVYTYKGIDSSGSRLISIFRRGGFVPAKRDGEIKPVDTPQVPDFEPNHAQLALHYLMMLGFSPAADWGDQSSSSGSDRNLQLAPAYQLSGLKQINWSAGLSRLFSQAFRMLEKEQTGKAYVSGETRSASSRKSERFGFELGPDTLPNDDDLGAEALPTTPEQLFGGDYRVNFVWANKIDPDDPAFVASELNKFAQGAQSLETTLERLGSTAPEDEMRRIENEADRFPWINQGRVAMLTAQLRGNAQGQGGGAPPESDIAGSLDVMGQPDGQALDTDAGFGSLPGGTGVPYGGA
jgi:hypothetical protein